MNPKLSAKALILFLLSHISISFCYSQASAMTVFDELVRTAQLYGKRDSLLSFCIRPSYSLSLDDSLFRDGVPFQSINNRIPKKLKGISVLPVTFQQQYNTHHSYGWNDGSMIPAKGYQNQASFGISYKKGLVSFQLRPEIVFAYNSYFPTFSNKHIDDAWYGYHEVNNIIDAPDRFGYGRYFKVFPGQSNLKINYRKLSLGISTENLWWGPGIRNSILMSNNAPGFPHVTFNTSKPIISSLVGSFEGQLISGILQGSNIIPDDTSRKANGALMYRPKSFSDRYINGVVVTWQPKWTKGLYLGLSRVFYQYVSDIKPGLDGYLPVIGKLFKKNLPMEDALKRDQLASFFFRLLLPKEKAEIYGEFGRNDHSYNLTDFLLQPEHSGAYTIGFSKIFDGKKKDLQLFAEMTNLQMPSTMLIRAGQSWYVHYQVREGYTNKGQVIGAGIGPGGSSETFGLKWISGLNRTGITIERFVHNNDYYFTIIGPMGQWRRNWVDLSLNGSKSWRSKNFIYDAQLSWIHSLNYQWYTQDVNNFSGRIGICYVL